MVTTHRRTPAGEVVVERSVLPREEAQERYQRRLAHPDTVAGSLTPMLGERGRIVLGDSAWPDAGVILHP